VSAKAPASLAGEAERRALGAFHGARPDPGLARCSSQIPTKCASQVRSTSSRWTLPPGGEGRPLAHDDIEGIRDRSLLDVESNVHAGLADPEFGIERHGLLRRTRCEARRYPGTRAHSIGDCRA
jgi:hypothetical protein